MKILQSDPRVTDEDLKTMGIVVPSTTRTHAPVAPEAPDCDIDTSVIGRCQSISLKKEAAIGKRNRKTTRRRNCMGGQR
ncbi:MAG: hypothetical protein LBD91_05230 [Prevotellaceae bacterium]|nr:hypothetical protein [Prevotellaceae bacterium]